MQRQVDRVVNEALEHVQKRIAIMSKDGDDLMQISRRKALKEPVGGPYASSSWDEARLVRRNKRNKRKRDEKYWQQKTVWTKTLVIQ